MKESKKIKLRKEYKIIHDDIIEFSKHILFHEIHYDRYGNIIADFSFDDHGDLQEMSKRIYSDNQELIQHTFEDHVHQTIQITEFIFENDLLKKTIVYYGENDFLETIYQYNDDGQVILIGEKSDKDELLNFTKFSYLVGSYDQVEEEFYEEEMICTTKRKLDEFGEVALEIIEYHVTNVITASKRKYLKKEHLLESEYYVDGVLQQQQKNIYNNDLDVSHIIIEYKIENEIIEQLFEFSDNGRKEKETTIENGETTKLIEIEYDENEWSIKTKITSKLDELHTLEKNFQYENEYY